MLETTITAFTLVFAQLPTQDSIDAPALFHEHCASCHGESGDGKGWAELDRQARSFKDGGFSFGNTPETILRTITHGIPGTPMPGFDPALSEEQRTALARHVISLGPPDMASEPSNTELVVLDRPLIVRGHLPPIVEGGREWPRGLLIGTLDGLTFEYRTDDVRLLGVRSGAYCDRSDWTGRGGTPLKPLGQVVVLQEGGDPLPTFWEGAVGTGTPLECRLLRTAVIDGRPSVSYDLLHPELGLVAHVVEEVESLPTPIGIGTRRRFRIERRGVQPGLVMDVARGRAFQGDPSVARPDLVGWFAQVDEPKGPRSTSTAFLQADGRVRWVLVKAMPILYNQIGYSTRIERSADRFDLELGMSLVAGEARTIVVTEFLLADPRPEDLSVLRGLPQ